MLRVKRGDVAITFTDSLTTDGQEMDLTDADAVLFILRELRANAPKVEAAATVVDAETGAVSYTTDAADLDTVGIYRQEWEVHGSGGENWTVPSSTHNVVRVVQDLNEEVGS